jgi:outer membrane protein
MMTFSVRSQKALAVALCCFWPVSTAIAQVASIEPVRPSAPVIIRPYLAAELPPVRLVNSGRLSDLIRAGKLYLTAQDAIRLALENNIDLEIARYSPIASAWNVERAEAGGALPGVPSSASQAGSVASGQGVAGSQAAAGVSGGVNIATGGNAGNATITQIGPVTQNLDPSIQETSTFSHRSIPQPNSVQSLVTNLITNTRVLNVSMQEGFLTGGTATVTFKDNYLNENAPTDVLNPSSAPNLAISFQHNLLRAFGIAVNARNITVAKINLKTSDLNFKTQVMSTVASVLNAYYALAADYEDLKAKKTAFETAQTSFKENQERVDLGALAPVDLTTAEALVASTQQDFIVSETTAQQQALQLKNLISRTGVANRLLADAELIPIDKLSIPDKDDLPSMQEMIQKALANRTDLLAAQASVTTSEVSALGTRNGLLPSLQAFGSLSNAGLGGTPRTVFGRRSDPYFTGGVGTGLGQVFRRNFPSERIGAFGSIPISNRQAQADYGIDELQLRQTELSNQKTFNQVGVDVMNSVIALRQARSRHQAAVQNRILAEQLLDAEQKKFRLGSSTSYNVVQQERDLTNAQSVELSALVSYTDARISLDQTLGTTLETNHVSIAEARSGIVAGPPAK